MAAYTDTSHSPSSSPAPPDSPVPAMFVAYQVCKITLGKPQGVLNLSYKLREVTQAAGANSYAPAQSAYTEAPPAAAYPPPTYR